MGLTVPEIVDAAIQQACRQIGIQASALDTGSIGAACNFSLNQQGLLFCRDLTDQAFAKFNEVL